MPQNLVPMPEKLIERGYYGDVREDEDADLVGLENKSAFRRGKVELVKKIERDSS